MKKKILAVAVSVLLAACGGSGQVSQKDTFHSNLKYISFWDSGIRVSNADSLSGNLLSLKNTSRISNAATIAVVGYEGRVSDGTMLAIKEAISNNQKIILILWTGIFDMGLATPDFDVRIRVAKETILDPYRKHLAAFYIADEPFLNARQHGVSFSDTQLSMDRLIDVLKSSYPEIPSLITYSHIEIDNEDVRKFGAGASWIGANIYHAQLGDPKLVNVYLDKLVSQKKPLQDIALVMDAFFIGEIDAGVLKCHPGVKEQGSLDINHASIAWANANPNTRVVAASVFLYNNVIDRGEAVCGASAMPRIVDQIGAINKKISEH